jgi:hypothetical protein
MRCGSGADAKDAEHGQGCESVVVVALLTCCTYPCMSSSALHSAGWIHMAIQAVSIDARTVRTRSTSTTSTSLTLDKEKGPERVVEFEVHGRPENPTF